MTRKNTGNICFTCERACGGCSWSEVDPETGKVRFEPVPGWTAEIVPLNLGYIGNTKRIVDTYHITACPLYKHNKKGGKRDG